MSRNLLLFMLKNTDEAGYLSKKYKIPIEDVLLIALNCCGVKSDTIEKRMRFKIRLNMCKKIFFLAICVNMSESPFYLDGNNLFLNGTHIGVLKDFEKDTCDSTYFRREGTAITLNSNSRSSCHGCKFCGTHNLEANDLDDLNSEENLKKYIENFLQKNNLKDLNKLIDVGICTGCFSGERETLNHILLVRRIFKKFGFTKNIKYIGSQINSKYSLKVLRKYALPFSIYYTCECFENRKKLLRYSKAEIKIDDIKNTLEFSKNQKINTSILYILGIESPEVVLKNFKDISPFLTRFPLINLFQIYDQKQEFLRIPEANNLEYYLSIRNGLENIFSKSKFGDKIRPWENYRGLWYLTYNNKKITNQEHNF